MAKLVWKRTGRKIFAKGTDTIYRAIGTDIEIESRKRHIKHANGIETWDHTTYWVLKDGKEIIERYSLKEAKEYAETLMGGSR